MKLSKNIVAKINVGDGLTDEELRSAIKFYSNLEESLLCLGKEFNLARAPVSHTLYSLESFWAARKRHL